VFHQHAEQLEWLAMLAFSRKSSAYFSESGSCLGDLATFEIYGREIGVAGHSSVTTG
jgi:hypothetical protein